MKIGPKRGVKQLLGASKAHAPGRLEDRTSCRWHDSCSAAAEGLETQRAGAGALHIKAFQYKMVHIQKWKICIYKNMVYVYIFLLYYIYICVLYNEQKRGFRVEIGGNPWDFSENIHGI